MDVLFIWNQIYLSLINFARTIQKTLKIDTTVFIVVVLFSYLAIPTIFYGNHDARMLDMVNVDDAYITQQLDGMTIPPYGNPANFLKGKNYNKIPPYWYNMRYGIAYYGGLYLDFAYIIFAPLKAMGVKTFPTAPIILKFFAYLFGLFSLLSLYNFSKSNFGYLPAIFACLFLLTDNYFINFSERIHPDTLVLFLAYVGLWSALEYSKRAKRTDLLTLAMIIGLLQGAKVAAPWMIPTAILSIYFASTKLSSLVTINSKLKMIFRNSIILILVSAVIFIITTPYLHDYLTGLKGLYSVIAHNKSEMFDHLNFISWFTEFKQYLAPFSLCAGLSFIYVSIKAIKSKNKDSTTALILAMCLSLSNFLWYAINGKLWVVIFYYLPTIGLLGLFMGITIQDGTDLLIKNNSFFTIKYSKYVTYTVFSAIVAWIMCTPFADSRWTVLVNYTLNKINLMNLTPFKSGTWVSKHLPHDSRILFDEYIYIDPTIIPDQTAATAVLQYSKMLKYKPEYMILTNHKNNWVEDKIKSQHDSQCDAAPNSVRLYQDLIPYSDKIWQTGATRIPHISLIYIQKPVTANSQLVYKIEPGFYAVWEDKCGKAIA